MRGHAAEECRSSARGTSRAARTATDAEREGTHGGYALPCFSTQRLEYSTEPLEHCSRMSSLQTPSLLMIALISSMVDSLLDLGVHRVHASPSPCAVACALVTWGMRHVLWLQAHVPNREDQGVRLGMCQRSGSSCLCASRLARGSAGRTRSGCQNAIPPPVSKH